MSLRTSLQAAFEFEVASLGEAQPLPFGEHLQLIGVLEHAPRRHHPCPAGRDVFDLQRRSSAVRHWQSQWHPKIAYVRPSPLRHWQFQRRPTFLLVRTCLPPSFQVFRFQSQRSRPRYVNIRTGNQWKVNEQEEENGRREEKVSEGVGLLTATMQIQGRRGEKEVGRASRVFELERLMGVMFPDATINDDSRFNDRSTRKGNMLG